MSNEEPTTFQDKEIIRLKTALKQIADEANLLGHPVEALIAQNSNRDFSMSYADVKAEHDEAGEHDICMACLVVQMVESGELVPKERIERVLEEVPAIVMDIAKAIYTTNEGTEASWAGTSLQDQYLNEARAALRVVVRTMQANVRSTEDKYGWYAFRLGMTQEQLDELMADE